MVTQGGDPYLSPPIKIEEHVVDVCSPSSSDPASSPYYYSNGGGYGGSQFLPGVDSLTGEILLGLELSNEYQYEGSIV